MKKLLTGLTFWLAVGCGVSDSNMTRLMKQEGVTEAQYDGYALFGCGQDDTFREKFHGKKNGAPVNGVVCGGLMKAYTVRYF